MKHALLSLILMAVFSNAGRAEAQSHEEKARAIMEKNKSVLVVVSVKAKLVTTTSGDETATKDPVRQTLGITVSDNGLIAVSNSAIDASVGLVGQELRIKEKMVTVQSAKIEFTSVEISYGDMTVLPGKIVWQDIDSDLAFVLPDQAEAKKANKTFDKVDLSQFASTADYPDRVVGLSRASSAFNFMVELVMGRITGVFEGVRHTYFVNTAGSSPGMPLFTLDGRPVGLTVVRVIEGQPTGVFATLSAGSIQAMAREAGG